MFTGSYIKVILDIAETDPHCKLSFVKSDLENARKELAELQAAQQSVQSDDCPSCAGSGKKEIGGMLLTCLACDGTGNRR